MDLSCWYVNFTFNSSIVQWCQQITEITCEVVKKLSDYGINIHFIVLDSHVCHNYFFTHNKVFKIGNKEYKVIRDGAHLLKNLSNQILNKVDMFFNNIKFVLEGKYDFKRVQTLTGLKNFFSEKTFYDVYAVHISEENYEQYKKFFMIIVRFVD
jgi:hypothetical protein